MTPDRSEMSSRDYEREAEASRHRLASNLRQLSDRLTPGQVIDEMLTYAKGGGGTFLKSLSNAARDNPVPSLLIGAGLLMFLSEKSGLSARLGHREETYGREYERRSAQARQGMRSAFDRAAEAGRNTMGGVTEAGRNAMGRVAETGAGISEAVSSGAEAFASGVRSTADQAMYGARRGAEGVGAAMASAAEMARSTAAGIGSGVSETSEALMHRAQELGEVVGETTARMRERIAETARTAPGMVGRRVADTRDNMLNMVTEQPLAAGAVGLAVGAAIAAFLPKTRAEDQLVGEAADTVKKSLGAFASDQVEAAKQAASTVTSRLAEEASKVAEEHGITPDGAAAAVQSATDKLKEAVGLHGTEDKEAGRPQPERH